MPWLLQRHPGLDQQLRELTERHRELEDEPLHLALAYDPGRDQDDVFVCEVLGNFAGGEANPDGELFEVTFHSTPQFPMAIGRSLHLVLTSLPELQVALAQGWDSAIELRDAVRRGDCEILFEDEVGAAALRLLRD
jgi:DNA-binding transcriptional LysR family regulator